MNPPVLHFEGIESDSPTSDRIPAVRIPYDTRDEMRLTLAVSSFALPRIDQLNQFQQVLDPHLRPAPAHHCIDIGEVGVGPIHWY
jgi:hypothetical protein